MQTVALSVRSLSKTFHNGSRGVAMPALREVSREIHAGEIIGSFEATTVCAS